MTLIVVNIAGAGASDVREKFLGKGFTSNYMMTIYPEVLKIRVILVQMGVHFVIGVLMGSFYTL
ncbi:MAG: hypothetical protein ACFFAU_19780, partial [Candidatus Hodarchaeota archaeon]